MQCKYVIIMQCTYIHTYKKIHTNRVVLGVELIESMESVSVLQCVMCVLMSSNNNVYHIMMWNYPQTFLPKNQLT